MNREQIEELIKDEETRHTVVMNILNAQLQNFTDSKISGNNGELDSSLQDWSVSGNLFNANLSGPGYYMQERKKKSRFRVVRFFRKKFGKYLKKNKKTESIKVSEDLIISYARSTKETLDELAELKKRRSRFIIGRIGAKKIDINISRFSYDLELAKGYIATTMNGLKENAEYSDLLQQLVSILGEEFMKECIPNCLTNETTATKSNSGESKKEVKEIATKSNSDEAKKEAKHFAPTSEEKIGFLKKLREEKIEFLKKIREEILQQANDSKVKHVPKHFK